MTKEAIKKNFWTLAFSGLLAFLLVPTDSFAQSSQITKRGGDDVYQQAKVNRNTAKKTYTNRTRNTTTNRSTRNKSVAKRDYRERTRTTSSTRRTTVTGNTAKSDYVNKRRTTTTTNSRTTTANRRLITENRGTRVNNSRYTKENVARNARSNYNYRANERNDYCNNYYSGLNNWNRTFWTSIHYTPNYYDLRYNRFPLTSGLRAQKVRFFGERYWLYDGVWFKKRLGRYYAVDAPTGVCIDALPLGGEMIWYRGDRFVIYRGTAYKMLPFGGFQVVQMLGRF
ncbi:MAG: DUF6515 family protein [Saprospiraceae bacterium]